MGLERIDCNQGEAIPEELVIECEPVVPGRLQSTAPRDLRYSIYSEADGVSIPNTSEAV